MKKAKLIFGVFGLAAIICFLGAVFLLVTRINMRKQIGQLEADLISQRKMARRDM